MYRCVLCRTENDTLGLCSQCGGLVEFSQEDPERSKGDKIGIWPLILMLALLGFLMKFSVWAS